MESSNKKTTLVFSSVALITAAFLSGCSGGGSGSTFSSPAGTFYGDRVSVGSGTARSFITRDSQSHPTAVGVKFTAAALTNLPTDPDTAFVLNLPAANGTPFDHISLDWESNGHPPDPIYTTPHFDVHFYMMTQAEQAAIQPPNGDTPAPAAQYLAPGYISTHDTVPNMGVHYIDPTSPEFNPPQPFSRTFIYGFYKGELKFLEPMIAKSFLDSKPNQTFAIKQPTAFQKSGFYPTSYSVHFDESAKEYTVTLEGLTKR